MQTITCALNINPIYICVMHTQMSVVTTPRERKLNKLGKERENGHINQLLPQHLPSTSSFHPIIPPQDNTSLMVSQQPSPKYLFTYHVLLFQKVLDAIIIGDATLTFGGTCTRIEFAPLELQIIVFIKKKDLPLFVKATQRTKYQCSVFNFVCH